MTERERLIELLNKKYDHFCDQCGVMTDNEIIKALECCNIVGNCKECPYEEIGCLTDNENKLLNDALDLINRQKAKIKEFDEKIVIQLGLINRQKAEIERLEKARQRQAKFLGEERGQKYDLLNKIGKAKSEAIKEFAERLEEKLQWDVEFENKLVFENDIDTLVKEMTEEVN